MKKTKRGQVCISALPLTKELAAKLGHGSVSKGIEMAVMEMAKQRLGFDAYAVNQSAKALEHE